MLAHHRWWLALIAVESIAGLWLEGDTRSVARALLVLASFACIAAGVITWFRWSQRDEAVRSPVDQKQVPPLDRRMLAMYVGAVVLFLVIANGLRATAADAGWFRPVMTIVVIAFWGFVATAHVRLIGRR